MQATLAEVHGSISSRLLRLRMLGARARVAAASPICARLTAWSRAAPPSQVTLLREPSGARRWMATIQHLQPMGALAAPPRGRARHRRARRSELNPPCPTGALYLPRARVFEREA
jgi:hypothetical protein